MSPEYPEQFLEGLRLFNDEEFFECHDVLEELWSETMGDDKKFLQGLIQAAVALFHFGNENFGGAKKLYRTSREKLEPYGEFYMGIDLNRFLADFQFCFQELLDCPEAYPSDIELRDERVPKIGWVDPQIS
jgi:predicted metal-dependent hydrolase